MKKRTIRSIAACLSMGLASVGASACGVVFGNQGSAASGNAGLGASDSLSALLGVSDAVASGGVMLVGLAVVYAMAGKWLALRALKAAKSVAPAPISIEMAPSRDLA